MGFCSGRALVPKTPSSQARELGSEDVVKMSRRNHPALFVIVTSLGIAILLTPDSVLRSPGAAISGILRRVAGSFTIPPSPTRPMHRQVPIAARPLLQRKTVQISELKNQVSQVLRYWAGAIRAAAKHPAAEAKLDPALSPHPVVKTAAVTPPTKPAVSQITPLGYVQMQGGEAEAIINGPGGIETVQTGQVLGSQRVVSISPYSVALAEVTPEAEEGGKSGIRPGANTLMASNLASPSPSAAQSRVIAKGKKPRSLGYVEMTNEPAESIFAEGSSVSLKATAVETAANIHWGKILQRPAKGETLLASSSMESREPASESPLIEARLHQAKTLGFVEWGNGTKFEAIVEGSEVNLVQTGTLLAKNSATASQQPSAPPAEPIGQELSVLRVPEGLRAQLLRDARAFGPISSGNSGAMTPEFLSDASLARELSTLRR